MIRQPIITVLGHVDHGKTSVLDYLRGSTVASKEAGLITQHIGATDVPLETIKQVTGDLLDKFKIKLTIPGLLFVDTPGHEAFTNLRKRGGSVADMAVVVIDINQGVQPQTKEAIEILKNSKVPFIVAANKVDKITNWKSHKKNFTKNYNMQIQSVKENFDNKFYNLLGQLSELGFDTDLYYKIEDYTKKVAIVPTSATTGEGLAELLSLITGLTQKFLENNLNIEVSGSAKGTVLEVKEQKGIGTTADIIIYDGSLRKDDTILIGGLGEVIKTKIKALLKPLPLKEIREKATKFDQVNEVHAAIGIKIAANDLDKVIAGAPLRAVRSAEEEAQAKEDIEKEIEEIAFDTEPMGIIVKTDTLGSMEALARMLSEKGVAVQRFAIGNINKGDVMEAVAKIEANPMNTFILGFNIDADPEIIKQAEDAKVKIITNQVIYKLLETYDEEYEKKKKELELEKLMGLVWPAKFKIMPGYVFRQSKPAVFGSEVLKGTLKPKVPVMNENGEYLGDIKTIEDKGKSLDELKQGQQAAVSIPGITIGRNAKEGDELYVDISESVFRKLKDRKDLLSGDDITILKEIAVIHRKERETWGL